MTELRIRMHHVRQLRGRGMTCTPGIRAWCDLHGINLQDFAANGAPESEARRIGGPFAEALLEIARKEQVPDGR